MLGFREPQRYRVWVVVDGKRTSGVKTIELLYGKAAATVKFLIVGK